MLVTALLAGCWAFVFWASRQVLANHRLVAGQVLFRPPELHVRSPRIRSEGGLEFSRVRVRANVTWAQDGARVAEK